MRVKTYRNQNLIIAELFLSSFLLATTYTVANPILIEISRSLNKSNVTTGYIFTFISMGAMLGVILSSLACKKWRRGHVLTAAFLLQFIGFAAVGLFRNLYMAYSLFFILGIAAGTINVQSNRIIGELYTKNSGLLFNLLHMFFGLGALIAPIASSFTIRMGMEWEVVFFMISFLCLINLIIFQFLKIPDADDFRIIKNSTSINSNTSEENYDRPHYNFLKSNIKYGISVFFLLAIATVFSAASQNGLSFWAPTYLREVRNLSELVSGWSLSLFWGMIAAGRLFTGILSKWIKLETIIMVSGFGVVGATLLIVLAGDPIIYITMFGFAGFFTAVFFPSFVSIGSTYYPDARNSVIPTLMVMGSVGTMLGSFIANVIYRFFNLSIAVLTASFLSIICSLFMAAIVMVRKFRQHDSYSFQENKQY